VLPVISRGIACGKLTLLMNWVVKEILQSNNVVWPEKPPRSSFPKEESGRKIRVGKSGNETGN
jgi:hypothetical protein